MMDRRTLLKRLGLAGLAVPAAMVMESKLVLPAEDRAKVVDALKQHEPSIYTVNGDVILDGSLEFRRELESVPVSYYTTEFRGPTKFRNGPVETRASWTMIEAPKFQPGDIVTIVIKDPRYVGWEPFSVQVYSIHARIGKYDAPAYYCEGWSLSK